ncbi:hypothetical protein [Pleionea sediminis]|uniref:hypothetical protein n=1 Tax=Pleionea sediminis TaxID=2569479 RepID=UPI00118587E5|nr:hypothetical protein [Pleionea sediminis]
MRELNQQEINWVAGGCGGADEEGEYSPNGDVIVKPEDGPETGIGGKEETINDWLNWLFGL